MAYDLSYLDQIRRRRELEQQKGATGAWGGQPRVARPPADAPVMGAARTAPSGPPPDAPMRGDAGPVPADAPLKEDEEGALGRRMRVMGASIAQGAGKDMGDWRTTPAQALANIFGGVAQGGAAADVAEDRHQQMQNEARYREAQIDLAQGAADRQAQQDAARGRVLGTLSPEERTKAELMGDQYGSYLAGREITPAQQAQIDMQRAQLDMNRANIDADNALARAQLEQQGAYQQGQLGLSREQLAASAADRRADETFRRAQLAQAAEQARVDNETRRGSADPLQGSDGKFYDRYTHKPLQIGATPAATPTAAPDLSFGAVPDDSDYLRRKMGFGY